MLSIEQDLNLLSNPRVYWVPNNIQLHAAGQELGFIDINLKRFRFLAGDLFSVDLMEKDIILN